MSRSLLQPTVEDIKEADKWLDEYSLSGDIEADPVRALACFGLFIKMKIQNS